MFVRQESLIVMREGVEGLSEDLVEEGNDRSSLEAEP